MPRASSGATRNEQPASDLAMTSRPNALAISSATLSSRRGHEDGPGGRHGLALREERRVDGDLVHGEGGVPVPRVVDGYGRGDAADQGRAVGGAYGELAFGDEAFLHHDAAGVGAAGHGHVEHFTAGLCQVEGAADAGAGVVEERQAFLGAGGGVQA
ncbi:hypothetical protein GCM10020001_093210 [Nonomuraea salmonea]